MSGEYDLQQEVIRAQEALDAARDKLTQYQIEHTAPRDFKKHPLKEWEIALRDRLLKEINEPPLSERIAKSGPGTGNKYVTFPIKTRRRGDSGTAEGFERSTEEETGFFQ